MSLIYDPGNYGVVASDLDGIDGKEVVFATEGPNLGGACLAAVRGDGTIMWRHELADIQWAPTRGWGPGALRTWSVGYFRGSRFADVYVAAHLNAMHSGTSRLLDGRDGSIVWTRTCLQDRVKEMGGGMVSIDDVDNDSLDDIAGGYCNYLFTLHGKTGEVRSASHSASMFHPVMPGSWIGSTTPILLGPEIAAGRRMLIARHSLAMALTDDRARELIWWRYPGGKMPGMGDVDGDGQIELGVAGPSKDGSSGKLWCLNPNSGESEWEMALPDAKTTDFATCDADGDQVDEFVFVCANRLYAVNGSGGAGHVLWALDLPTAAAAPVIGDVDGDGQSEILVVGADGFLYCVDEAGDVTP
jgi:outer membrane protein assembly factor BamB